MLLLMLILLLVRRCQLNSIRALFLRDVGCLLILDKERRERNDIEIIEQIKRDARTSEDYDDVSPPPSSTLPSR